MRTVTFIILILLSQNVSAGLFVYLQNVAASIFSDFQSAITSVGESLGKLVTDVVSDVKETVDCTIMAVERVLAIGGIMENNPEYDQRCKPVDNTTTIKAPPDNTENFQPNPEIIQVIVTKPPTIENIEENVTNINMSISNVDCDTDGIDIEKAQEALRNRTQHLKEISALLKQRFDILSEEMKNTIEKKLENDTIALIREIWKELSIVTDLKKKTNNNSEDKNLNEVLDQVLGLFKVKETPNESLKDKIEALRDDLQKEANITLSEVHYPENEFRSDKKIDGNFNLNLETTTDHNIIQNNSSYQSEEDRPLALHARNVLENEYPDYSEIAQEQKRYNDNYYSDYGEPLTIPNNEEKYLNNEISTTKPNIYNNPYKTIPSSIPNIYDGFYNTPKSVIEDRPNIYDQTLIGSSTPTNDLYTNNILENSLISTPLQLENLATTTPKLVSIYDYVLSTTSRPMSDQSMNNTTEKFENTTNIDNPFMTTTKLDQFTLTTTANPIEAQTTIEIPGMILTTLPVSEYSENTELNVITSSSILTYPEEQTTESSTDNIMVTTTMPTDSVMLTDSQINNIATTTTTVIEPGTYFIPEDPIVTTTSPIDPVNESFSSTEIGVTNYTLTMDADATTLLPDIISTSVLMNDGIKQNVSDDYLETTPVVYDDAKVSTLLPENVMFTPSKSDVTTPILTIVNITSIIKDTATTEVYNDATKIPESDLMSTTINLQGDIFETTTNNPYSYFDKNVPDNTEETNLVKTKLATELNNSASTTTMPSVEITASSRTYNYETTTELSNETLEPDDMMTTTESNDLQTTTDNVLETTTEIPVLTTISPYFDDVTLSPDYYSMFDLPQGEEARKLVAEAQDLMKQQFASANLMNAVNNAKSYDDAKSVFDNFFTGNDDTNNNNDDYDDTNDNSYDDDNDV